MKENAIALMINWVIIRQGEVNIVESWSLLTSVLTFFRLYMRQMTFRVVTSAVIISFFLIVNLIGSCVVTTIYSDVNSNCEQKGCSYNSPAWLKSRFLSLRYPYLAGCIGVTASTEGQDYNSCRWRWINVK